MGNLSNLPQNFNFYVCGVGELQNFSNRDINYWITYSHPGNWYPPSLDFFGKLENLYLYEYHDVWDEHHPKCLKWPDKQLVDEIITRAIHIDQLLKSGEQVNLLVTCTAGISRSTATAYIILCYLLGDYNEQFAKAYLLQQRSIADPNPLIVSMADEALGKNGKMIQPLPNVFACHNEKKKID